VKFDIKNISFLSFIVAILLVCSDSNAAGRTSENALVNGYYILDSVLIIGTTNVSKFSLNYSQRAKPESFVSGEVRESNGEQKVSFAVPVKDVVASQRLMKRDFEDMIDADNHPRILIEILSDDIYRILNDFGEGSTALDLSIAGSQQQYMSSVFVENSDKHISINGNIKLLLTDFGLKLPSKLFGLVRVRDDVVIDYSITFFK
jgi:hypothetical protein